MRVHEDNVNGLHPGVMSLVEATWDGCECNVEKGLRSFVLSLIRTYLGWFILLVRTQSGRFVLTD